MEVIRVETMLCDQFLLEELGLGLHEIPIAEFQRILKECAGD